jgi:hypothetical protein
VSDYICQDLFLISEIAQLFELFFCGKSCVLILTKNGLGYILGDFCQTHQATLDGTNA